MFVLINHHFSCFYLRCLFLTILDLVTLHWMFVYSNISFAFCHLLFLAVIHFYLFSTLIFLYFFLSVIHLFVHIIDICFCLLLYEKVSFKKSFKSKIKMVHLHVSVESLHKKFQIRKVSNKKSFK